MSITGFSLANSRLVLFLFFMLTSIGLALYPSYPSQEEPTLPINVTVITAYHPGLDIYQTESLLARPVERALRELEETKNITTSIRAGEIHISLEIKDGTPDYAQSWLRVRAKMQDVQNSLPDGVSGPFVNDSYDAVAVMTVAISAPNHTFEQLRNKASELRDFLYDISGMDKVTLHGVTEEQVTINLKPFAASKFSIKPNDIYLQLHKNNSLDDIARVNFSGQESRIYVRGGYNSIEDIKAIPIVLQDGSQLPLDTLADVIRSTAQPLNTAAYLNGGQAIVVAGYMTPGVNMVDFNDRLRTQIAKWEHDLPAGFQLKIITDQGEVVNQVISKMISTLLETILVVTVVTVIALGLRAGSLVGLAVPITGIMTLVVLRVLGVELNEVSIASFIIALGILVDNPMVIVEDISKRINQGESGKSAALQAGKTLGTPMLIASLTVILAFAPPMFTDNITAIYMQTLTIVIGVMLIISWFVAIMLVPILAQWSIRKGKNTSEQSKLSRCLMMSMARFWDKVISWPKAFLAGATASLILSLFLSATIPEAFFPPSERSQMQISLEIPAGTPANRTAEVAQEMTRWLAEEQRFPQITGATAYVSEGGPRFILGLNPPEPAPHTAYFVINLSKETNVAAFVNQLRAEMPPVFPYVKLVINPFFMGSTPPGEAAIRIIGNNHSDLLQAATTIQEALGKVDGTINIKQDWEQPIPSLVVNVDQAAASYAGVTREDIFFALRKNTLGESISELREGEFLLPIMLAMPTDNATLSQLNNIQIFSQSSDKTVYLSEIARVDTEFHPSIVKKRNLRPTLTVTALNPAMTSKELVSNIAVTLEQVRNTSKVQIEFGGEIEESEVTAEAIFAFLPLCVLMMIILFIHKYNSFRKVAIIVLSIPFCAIGLLLALIIFRLPFDFMANLAIFALIGIIVSNAMLIIEQIDIEKDTGKSELESLKSALMQRFRPIMLTQITTILGLIPLIIANDPLWRSFNVVIMGGLISGTIASFIVVPSLYVLFFTKKQQGRSK
ncbi:efflux RND transporter permease subunit [Vibrio metschnikovii]|nr:efflux RND transporter permease subunit [Vibrio metschnikovii]